MQFCQSRKRKEKNCYALSMLGGFASVLTLFSLEPLPLMACETINNGNYNKITTQLEKSLDVTIRNISCDERQSIDKMNIDDVLLTPSRKNGSRTICITDTEQYPCKFHIAVIAVGASPSDVLLGTFKAKAQQNKTSVLNETTERLFVRASSIIR